MEGSVVVEPRWQSIHSALEQMPITPHEALQVCSSILQATGEGVDLPWHVQKAEKLGLLRIRITREAVIGALLAQTQVKELIANAPRELQIRYNRWIKALFSPHWQSQLTVKVAPDPLEIERKRVAEERALKQRELQRLRQRLFQGLPLHLPQFLLDPYQNALHKALQAIQVDEPPAEAIEEARLWFARCEVVDANSPELLRLDELMHQLPHTLAPLLKIHLAEELLEALEGPGDVASCLKQLIQLLEALPQRLEEEEKRYLREADLYVRLSISPPLSEFSDLRQSLEQQLSGTQLDPWQWLDVVGWDVEVIIAPLMRRNDERLAAMKSIYEEAKARERTLHESIAQLDEVEDKLLSFQKERSLVRDSEALLAVLPGIFTHRKVLRRNDPAHCKADFEALVAEQSSWSQAANELVQQLKEKELNYYEERRSVRHAICRSFPEVFGDITPYRDLDTLQSTVRATLMSHMQSIELRHVEGKLTQEEYLAALPPLLRDHDARELRLEIRGRALRLWEIGDEVERGLRRLMRAAWELRLAGGRASREYEEVERLTEALRSKFAVTQDPFLAFFNCHSVESINIALRNIWIAVEDLQPQLERAVMAAEKAAQIRDSEGWEHISAGLDRLEGLILEMQGSRPQLVAYVEGMRRETKGSHWQTTCAALRELEARYPALVPLAFFLQPDLKERKSVMRKALELHVQRGIFVTFAKSMQQKLLVDEERVDDMMRELRLFNLIYANGEISDTAWKHHRMGLEATLEVCERALVMEMGFCERSSLNEEDPEGNRRLWQEGCRRMRKHIEKLVQAKQQEIPLLNFACAHLQEAVAHWQEENPFQALRKAAHILYDAGILNNSRAEPRVKREQWEIAWHALCLHIRELLLDQRSGAGVAVVPEWQALVQRLTALELSDASPEDIDRLMSEMVKAIPDLNKEALPLPE